MATQIALSDYSELQLARLRYVPELPAALSGACTTSAGGATLALAGVDDGVMRSWFPKTYGQTTVDIGPAAASASASASASAAPCGGAALRVGVVFCGRQTPGAHNLVIGLCDALAARNSATVVLGFVGGTKGLFAGATVALTPALLAGFRNQGGMHLLGRSVDRIRSPAEQAAALASAEALQLDGLLLVGGTFTNTDAAHLAEYFAQRQGAAGRRTAIVGAPVSIDGDMKNEFVETTLGHDTATKLYAQLVGNMATDSNSAKKYTYYIKLMGRATGHITMEVALQSRPNVVILGACGRRR